MKESDLKDKKVCFACGSNTTYIDTKRNKVHWYRQNGHYLCEKCNNRYYKNRKWHPINGPRRISFKGKAIYTKTNPRIGTCTFCKRTIKNGELKRTVMHHIEYDELNPLAHTVELCSRCHINYHRERRSTV